MSENMVNVEGCQVYLRKENVMAKQKAKWKYSSIQWYKWMSQSFLKSITGLDCNAVFVG